MKRQILPFLTFAFTLLFFGAASQTQVIEYSHESLSTCNIFSSAVSVDGYSHLTTLGRPSFEDNSVLLSTKTNGSNSVLSTIYSIAYPFKAGYSYKISIYYKGAKGAADGLLPTVGLKISGDNGGIDDGTSCSDPSAYDLSTASTYTMGISGSTYAYASSLINTTLSQNANYLLVGAFPTVNTTQPAKIYVRKIEILETGPALSLTPSSLSLTCGTTNPQTFSVSSNASYIQGTVSYEWNLGSASNGWLYNGNAAPQNISTSSSSITLTPSGSSNLSNVAVTVKVNGSTYTTLNSFISIISNFAINGDNAVCATSNTYSIPFLPTGATVQWQASPAGVVTINSPNSQQTTLTKVNDGEVTLSAIITNACSASPVTVTKPNILVGLPNIVTGYNDGSGNIIGTEEYPEINTVCQINNPTQVHTNLEIQGATSVVWTRVQDISGRVTSGQYGPYNISLGFRLAGQSGLFQLNATNGCGTLTKQYVFASENCGLLYSVSPNPASSTATISTKESTPQTTSQSQDLGITEINIYDQSGNIKKHQKYTKTKKATLDINGLKSGFYFIEIVNGEYREKQQFIIRK